ncbi:Ig-like domain-containing protein [Novosphingobium aquimarinum]|uniref:Ig-like domain-containing protein n=1 Tax=Novosphingobium aquimarinum TaxID=2682494 RepID=UPI0012EC2F16|nr:Ig-like domain-containing protein [Novosphingobium aquimarinum]
MSTKVVTAPAKAAKPLVHKGKQAHAAEQAQPIPEDDAKVVGKEARVTEESEKVILAQADDAKEGKESREEASETALAANFSFAGELAQAAASSGSLVTEAGEVESVGYAQEGGGPGGTVLLIGAVALVGLGIYVLADGGDDDDQDLPPLNVAPVFGTAPTVAAIAEDSDGTTFTVTATDADNDPLTYTLGTITGGTATISNGTVTFVPADDFNGNATVVVNVSDGTASASQTVTIPVTPVNDAPVAGDATLAVTGTEDQDLVITPTITDPDGEDLTFTFTDPAHGSIEVNDDGTLTYTPDDNYFGTDSFVLTGTDEAGLSATQTINITLADDMDPNDPTGPMDVSIDVGTNSSSVTLDDAADAAVNFVDDVDAVTNVILTGVGDDDTITIMGDSDDYSIASVGNDIRITFSDGNTIFNDIVVEDILPDDFTGFVFDEQSAELAVGFDLINFG